MTYWESIIGSRVRNLRFGNNAQENYNMYIQGLIDGIEAYAVWKNGEQVCGIREETLHKVKEEIYKTGRECLVKYL